MGASRSRSPSQRQLRVGEQVRHVLVETLAQADFDDPDLAEANVTVTQVQVSPDLKNATVFVIPLGGVKMDETVAALNRAAGYLRGQLGRAVALRFTPRLEFAPDRSFENADRIERILQAPRVRRDLEAADRPESPENEEPDHGA